MIIDGVDNESGLEASLLKSFGARLGKLDRLHQAEAAYLLAPEVLERCMQQVAHLGRMADQAIALDHLQHGEGRGARERITAEGRTGVSRHETISAGVGQ